MTPEVRKEYQRSRALIIKYGITAREYDAILAKQGGRCYVCRELPGKTRLAVEHRHGDGLLRGLVCWQCNKAIAYIRDNTSRAAALLEFLMYPPAVSALGREVYGRTGRVTRKWRTKREKRERMESLADLLKADKAYYQKGEDHGREDQQESTTRDGDGSKPQHAAVREPGVRRVRQEDSTAPSEVAAV